MKKTDLAYYAGIFDGEGCIGIYRSKKQGYINYTLLCQVANCKEWLIQSLKMAFDGSVRLQKRYSALHNQAWIWGVSAKQAATFLRAIYPYLRLKKPQADLALSFQSAKHHRKGIRQTDEELAILEAQRILMSNLKGKRQSAPTVLFHA